MSLFDSSYSPFFASFHALSAATGRILIFLKFHVRKIHMGIGMATCTECGKELSSAQKLRQHVRNVHLESPKKKRYKGHPDWKPYRSESELGQPKCKTCGKEYSCASHLKIHVRSVHILKGLKPTESSAKIPVANTA